MAYFAPIDPLDESLFTFAHLGVSGTLLLDDPDYDQLRRVLGLTEDSYHLTARRPFAVGSISAEIRSVIGIHAPSKAEPDSGYVHLEFEVDPRRNPKEQSVEEWSRALDVMNSLAPAGPLSVQMRLLSPATSLLAVSLPLQVQVPGFSEVRGVRLSKSDPNDPEGELYFVALDRFRDRISVYAHTVANLKIEERMLANAAASILPIVGLAITKG